MPPRTVHQGSTIKVFHSIFHDQTSCLYFHSTIQVELPYTLPPQHLDILTIMSKPTPTSTTTQIIPADTLPPELWLDIIPRVPYSPRSLLNIRLTCHRLNTLTTQHETSLVADIKRQQCSSTQTGRFPGLELVGYRDLSTLYGRQQTLDQVHKHWLKVTYASPELKWLKGRWEGIHKTGLLLLYHLQDVEPLSTHEAHSHSKTSEDAIDWVAHCAKVRLLESLPATSLACLLFQLMASIHILRIHGPEPISNKYAAGDVGTRTEVELAFEELLLTHGPDIFMGMLDEGHAKREWTIA